MEAPPFWVIAIPPALAIVLNAAWAYCTYSDRAESEITKGCRKIPIHLFRTFPPGAAGLGLFLLRVITAFTLGYSGYLVHGRAAIPAASIISLAKLISLMLPLLGVLMILGFATLVCGVLCCGLLALSIGRLNLGSNDLFLIAGGLSLVLVLVGPGAYSLDARLFGLRRIEIIGRTSLTRNKHRDGR